MATGFVEATRILGGQFFFNCVLRHRLLPGTEVQGTHRRGSMYTLFAILSDGESLRVASRDTLGEAVHLGRELNASWPREYVVRDSEGNNFDPGEFSIDQGEDSASSGFRPGKPGSMRMDDRSSKPFDLMAASL